MKAPNKFRLCPMLKGFAAIGLLGACAWSQDGTQTNTPAAPVPAVSGPVIGMGNRTNAASPDDSADLNLNHEDRMLTPPPVSGQVYPLFATSEERSNYLRGGVIFSAAYSDNVLGSTSSAPVSDISYSIWPTVAIDQTRSRLHWVLTYAPGFTFYNRVTSRNEADQNFNLDLQYRLSPHVTVSLRDALQKSSNVFNQPGQGLTSPISGSDTGFNNSILAPIADRLANNTYGGISYQFSANDMIGASGFFSNLHYPDPNQVPGLYDSATRGVSGFFSHRLAAQHYVGVTYQYQELLSYPAAATNQTQTNAALFFYTYAPARTFSISFFGGPQQYNEGTQYISAAQPASPGTTAWKPAGGASLNWQALHTAFALSYSHSVSGGGGLVGAVELDNASASLRQQLTRNFAALVSGGYANNGVLSPTVQGGHSISASAGLDRQIGSQFDVQAGYTRIHQTYEVFSANPDTNRESVSISYQFSRPLGR